MSYKLTYEPAPRRKPFVLRRKGRSVARLNMRETKSLLGSTVAAMMARISELPK